MGVMGSVVTDADLKVNEKMATVVGIFLCNMLRSFPKARKGYNVVRHSLRSGSWDVVGVWKMLR